MNRATRIFALGIVVALSFAPSANGQIAVSAASLRSAQTTAGPAKLLNVRRIAADTLVVEFEDSALTFDKIQHGVWTFGPVGQSARSPKQVGREIANSIWNGVPRDSEITAIVVNVQSAKKDNDATNVRLFYRTNELSRR